MQNFDYIRNEQLSAHLLSLDNKREEKEECKLCLNEMQNPRLGHMKDGSVIEMCDTCYDMGIQYGEINEQ